MGLGASVGGGESVVKAVDGGPLGVVVVVVGGLVGPAGDGDKVTAELKLNVEIIEGKCKMESVNGMKSSLAF